MNNPKLRSKLPELRFLIDNKEIFKFSIVITFYYLHFSDQFNDNKLVNNKFKKLQILTMY